MAFYRSISSNAVIIPQSKSQHHHARPLQTSFHLNNSFDATENITTIAPRPPHPLLRRHKNPRTYMSTFLFLHLPFPLPPFSTPAPSQKQLNTPNHPISDSTASTPLHPVLSISIPLHEHRRSINYKVQDSTACERSAQASLAISSHLIPLNPIHPIQSNPIPSHPISQQR